VAACGQRPPWRASSGRPCTCRAWLPVLHTDTCTVAIVTALSCSCASLRACVVQQLSGFAPGARHTFAVRATRPYPCPAADAVSTEWDEPAEGVGEVRITGAPVGAAFSSFASFSFESTAAPGTTTFQYSLDDASWTASSFSLRLGPLSPGPHTLRVRSTDGIVVSAVQSAAWTILAQSSNRLQV
jgi:hypothetical protein